MVESKLVLKATIQQGYIQHHSCTPLRGVHHKPTMYVAKLLAAFRRSFLAEVNQAASASRGTP